MANIPIEMSKLRQILKLYSKGIGKKKIADRLATSKNTVKSYIEQLDQKGISLEDVLKLSDLELNNLFNPPKIDYYSDRTKVLFDFFPEAERLLRKRGVTRMFVYREYKLRHPDGFERTQFYDYFARWSNKVKPTMRIEHIAGDKMYMDYAGATLPYLDTVSGKVMDAQVFVAILGWSQYAYVEALRDQTIPEFIAGSENALHFFEGVPLALVPDNLKSAVTRPHKYEPTLNENFKRFADHYGTACVPARSRKPQDKAHVENMVKLLYQRVYAHLPDDTVFTLQQLNERILVHLKAHNDTPIKDLNSTRTDRWKLEKNALNPLPQNRFEIRTIRQVTVQKSCHVLHSEDNHHYSVPFEYVRKKLKMMYSRSIVEIYDNYRLVATHKRVRSAGNYSTIPQHLPPEHQHILSLSPQQYITRARSIDPAVEIYIRNVLDKKPYPQQAFRSCDGILSFDKKIGRDRLINACKLGNDIGRYGYKVIESILQRGLDQVERDETTGNMPDHGNIRADYI